MHKEIQWQVLFFLFCYFCLKAGADRSRVRGTRQIKTVLQYNTCFPSHHQRKRSSQRRREREKERESENRMARFLFRLCTNGDIEGQILQHRVRVEATLYHSGCVLSSGQVTIIRVCVWWIRLREKKRGLRVHRRWRQGVITSIAEKSMKRGAVRRELLTVGASGGQPQAYAHLCVFFKLKCLFFSSSSLFPYIAL